MLAMYSIPVISDCIATYHSKKKSVGLLMQAQVTNICEQKNMQQKAQGHTVVHWKVSTV